MQDIFEGLNEKMAILNEDGEKTGEAKGYDEVHVEGLLHSSTHVWVLNSKKQLLLQKRSKYVRVYPGFWDSSASGHISFEQTALQAAQLEIKGELGLDLSPEAFKYLFTIREHYVSNKGTYIENAFNIIYLVQLDLKIEELKTDPKEVSELKWIDLLEFKKWVSGEGEPLTTHQEEFEKLIEHIEK